MYCILTTAVTWGRRNGSCHSGSFDSFQRLCAIEKQTWDLVVEIRFQLDLLLLNQLPVVQP